MSGPRTRAGSCCFVAVLAVVAVASCGGDSDESRPTLDATFATQPPASVATTTPDDTASPPEDTTTPDDSTAPPDDTTAPDDTASLPDDTASPPVATRPQAVLGEPVAVVEEPVDLAVRPGQPPTEYLVERAGRVWILDAERRPGVGAADLSDETEAGGEQGLLGLTFSADGQRAYVNYTTNSGDTAIEEFAVLADGTFDAASRRSVYEIAQPYSNHNGGALATGPDGMLYVFTGDGGAAGDPERRSLDLTSPLGKVLRFDPSPSGDRAFTIPADNPFVGVEGALGEIWAVGVRNPWRSAFDAETSDLWMADVGQGEWEEISVGWATDGRDAGRGLSFGWSAFEGTHRFNDDQPEAGHTPPIYEYPHGELGCSISGGVRYRGDDVPGLHGWYVFSDYCSGLVRALEVLPDRTAGEVIELGEVSASAAVVADAEGELLVLSLNGEIVPIVAAP